MLSMYVSLFCETTYLSEHESSLECHTCYIPIFYFKLHPKFPFLFHTPMFLMSSYSILQCFPIPHSDVSQSSDIFSHSNVLPTPTFLKSSCSIPCSNIFPHFPHFLMFSLFFYYFYRCGTFSVTSWTLFLKHHNLRSIIDSLLHVTFYILPFIYYSIDIHPL